MISSALLGQAIQPYWLHRDVKALQGHRTLMFMGSILILEFIVKPLVNINHLPTEEPLVLAGVTFLAGLIWRRKALFTAPVILILCYFIGIFAYGDGSLQMMLSYMSRFALIAFPFAFMGALVGERAQTRKPARASINVIDISPLAKLLRELDMWSTLQAFIAVVAPLLVLVNIKRVFELVSSFGGNTLMLALSFIILAPSILAPILFIIRDWLSRRESGQYIKAVEGASAGVLVISVIALIVGAGLLMLYQSTGLNPFDFPLWVISGGILLVIVFLLKRLVVNTETVQRRAQEIRLHIVAASLLLIAGGTLIGKVFSLVSVHKVEIIPFILTNLEDIITLTSAMIIIWFLLKIVNTGLILAGIRQRLLLYSDLRGGFWVRMAFLAGLPSIMWKRSTMKTPAFWLFILSRPLVFMGVYLAVSEFLSFSPVVKIGIGVIFIIAGHLAFLAGKRMASRQIIDWEVNKNIQNPILFLRSFEDDHFDFKRSTWDIWGRFLDLWSFRSNADELLVDEVANYGPVIALGKPGETKVPFGAQRYYANHEEWQVLVTEAAKKAQTIVLVAGDSPGVLWEYNLLKEEGLINRTLLLFTPGVQKAASNSRALEAFSQVQKVNAVVENDQQMVALMQTDSGPVLLVAKENIASAYLAAVRTHFQRHSFLSGGDPAVIIAETNFSMKSETGENAPYQPIGGAEFSFIRNPIASAAKLLVVCAVFVIFSMVVLQSF